MSDAHPNSAVVQPSLIPSPPLDTSSTLTADEYTMTLSPTTIAKTSSDKATRRDRREYSPAERRAHVATARECAEQLRRLHLARGAYPSPAASSSSIDDSSSPESSSSSLPSATPTRSDPSSSRTEPSCSSSSTSEPRSSSPPHEPRGCAKTDRSGADPVRRDEAFETYFVEVERIEGGKKVSRKVKVIIPRGASVIPFRHHHLSALTLLPPPSLPEPSLYPNPPRACDPSNSGRVPRQRHPTVPLREGPLLHTFNALSFVPGSRSNTTTTTTTPNVSPYRSRATTSSSSLASSSPSSPSSSKDCSRSPACDPPRRPIRPLPTPFSPSRTMTRPRPTTTPVINLDTTSALLQRRRAALSIRTRRDRTRSTSTVVGGPNSFDHGDEGDGHARAWTCASGGRGDAMRDERRNWNVTKGDAEEEGEDAPQEATTGQRVKREREVSLGERRGKKVRVLRLV
ncbi:hypothetical protein JCM10212_004236 [Sporobolomyces blumeae]